jgi:hypothetical protein
MSASDPHLSFLACQDVLYSENVEKEDETPAAEEPSATERPPPFSGNKFIWVAGDITIIKAPEK